ncbi:MAG: 4-alpha-glucanotransferase [Bacteroidales bacterium]|nr:4-alpha-glucanotransferase [Bacteroidales bacterium]
MNNLRGSGLLLHITSLPGDYGVGDFGKNAFRFVDFLNETGTRFWQVLPLNPTDNALGNSPYSSSSAFALNPLLIDPEQLLESGLVEQSDLISISTAKGKVNYLQAYEFKKKILHEAYLNFKSAGNRVEFQLFCNRHKHWLEDYAMFTAFKDYFSGKVWTSWPEDIRNRKSGALQELREELYDQVEKAMFAQFLLAKQWFALRDHCNEAGIQLIGDIPIYVQHDSADVWANPRFFKLDKKGDPTFVAGVPPDYFSETGQLWGNPVYDWNALKKDRYDFWVKRLRHNFALYDIVRIDHFRGLVGYWEIPAGEETAINGKWVEAPVWDFYNEITKRFSFLPVIAEDLGEITPDVREFIMKTGFPGMRILQFGMMSKDPSDPFMPHNYLNNCVAYTGTHDNNTLKGWYQNEIEDHQRDWLNKYVGKNIHEDNVSFELIRMLLQSAAGMAVIQMQDLLDLDEGDRMNKPGSTGYWEFAFNWEDLSQERRDFLKELNVLYQR